MTSLDESYFKNPPDSFHGVPFWSINDKLDAKEIRHQVRLLKSAGYGGAFFHAREGLITPYLSKEWLNMFASAIEESKNIGFNVWIYDENRWPSGFAGGLIPALGPKYRAKGLVLIPDSKVYSGPEVIARFKCTLDKNGMPVAYEPAKEGEEGSEYLFLTFVVSVAANGRAWYDGFNYVDLLSSEAVKAYIKLGYEPYLRFREKFGRQIPGAFTDEPNVSATHHLERRTNIPPRGHQYPIYSIPWTDKLPEIFKERRGYNLLEKLPELFFNIGNYKKTRLDFWRTFTELFTESFTKQIYEWCDKYGLKFTGHLLAEETLLSQLHTAGAMMPNYEYMHIPGIDQLGYRIWYLLLTAKQVASVASQLGKDRVLCETYGCTGNYPSFSDRKWIGDFLLAMGVNLFTHHLVPYSMRGRRKRDYGLNFHWSQPWWRYNRLIEDYLARLSYILSQGSRVIEVLVIHPIVGAWCSYTPINESEVKRLDGLFRKLLEKLVELGVDFELGDELLLAKYANITDSGFKVGRQIYRVVLVPSTPCILNSTLNLLEKYVSKGGRVVFIEPTPNLIDGYSNEKLIHLIEKSIRYRIEDLTLEDLLDKPIIRLESKGIRKILYHMRKLDNQLMLFIINTSREEKFRVKIGIRGEWYVEEWDPFTGEIREMGATLKEETTWLDTSLYPVDSHLFILKPGKPVPPQPKPDFTEERVHGPWRLKLLDNNVLVVDFCELSANDVDYGLLSTYKAQKILSDIGAGTKYRLKYRFVVKHKPSGDLWLVVEEGDKFKVKINGVEVKWNEGHWIDWNFLKTKVTEIVREGENVVEIEGVMNLDRYIEPIYLLGRFKVKFGEDKPYIDGDVLEEVELGDFTQSGLPFYAGRIVLTKKINIKSPKVFLELEDLNAALAIIRVNKAEKYAIIPPYRINLTDIVQKEENEIEIELVGTLKNVLGPLHREDPISIGPGTFEDESTWTNKYILKPFGLNSIKLLYPKL